jgi:hypothetical protein
LEQLKQLSYASFDDEAASHALEVASGSGAHIEVYAPALPQFVWHPSEAEIHLIAALDAFGCDRSANVAPAVALDAAAPPSAWPAAVRAHARRYALVVASNLCHIAPWDVTLGLLRGAADVLAPGGWLAVYGAFTPFPSEGDALAADQRFDAGQ